VSRLVPVLLLAAVVLAGCGGDDVRTVTTTATTRTLAAPPSTPPSRTAYQTKLSGAVGDVAAEVGSPAGILKASEIDGTRRLLAQARSVATDVPAGEEAFAKPVAADLARLERDLAALRRTIVDGDGDGRIAAAEQVQDDLYALAAATSVRN
jgi:hypothetical protein